jgi:probable HAF family extracellular repeat protein
MADGRCAWCCHHGCLGINDAAQVVGAFWDSAGREHGFLDTKGRFTTFDVPATAGTELVGINDHGEIAGNWFDSEGVEHGFTASQSAKPGGHNLISGKGGFVAPTATLDTNMIVGPLHGAG